MTYILQEAAGALGLVPAVGRGRCKKVGSVSTVPFRVRLPAGKPGCILPKSILPKSYQPRHEMPFLFLPGDSVLQSSPEGTKSFLQLVAPAAALFGNDPFTAGGSIGFSFLSGPLEMAEIRKVTILYPNMSCYSSFTQPKHQTSSVEGQSVS